MENTCYLTGDVLENVPGFHQYLLEEPIRLCYASGNLCAMTGYAPAELVRDAEDGYARLVHPADRERYRQMLAEVAEAGAAEAEYRLVKKDGGTLHVRDTITAARQTDGTSVASSVLADITGLKQENEDLQFLNSTIPCGFLKYTCEKQPRVTYVNQQMMEFLRFPKQREGELDYLELYKSNIFLMIPMEERRKFALYLNQVYSAGKPLAGEMTLLRCDGTKLHVFGWVIKCVDANGVPEFQSVCMDISERHQAKRETATRSYLKALADVYDMVFEYDLDANTVRCLFGSNSPTFKMLEDIPMQMDGATEKWIADTVVEEDKERLRAFFRDFYQNRLYQDGQKPPRVTYHARTSGGEVKLYSGIFLKITPAVSFYCCRLVPDTEEADQLKSENASLKENLQELVMRFTDGVAAFEVKGDLATPLYASDNILEFFGMTREEWMPLMRKATPIRDLIARSETSMERIEELLENGEAEFTYFDLKSETERQIKAICSMRAPSGMPRYIMLYKVEKPRQPVSTAEETAVSIRTFGYFDVFVGEKPIAFRNKKSKELFALLVDRKGGFVSSEEAIGFLWEDEPVNPVTLARYRKVALRLKNILEEYGIADVMETVDGKRRIVMEQVQCDLYDYLSGKEEYAHLFKGSYLTNYSWGENTLAELTGEMV